MEPQEAREGQAGDAPACCRARLQRRAQEPKSAHGHDRQATTATTTTTTTTTKRIQTKLASGGKSQFSSFILFASVIILINLCSFQLDLFEPPMAIEQSNLGDPTPRAGQPHEPLVASKLPASTTGQVEFQARGRRVTYLQSCLEFVRLIFRQPMRLSKRTTRFSQAEARVLGKMAKVWYIKKKIKKLSKKLKKHTIAVPVFTAIPIYEHSYYPQPHVTHVSHGGGMHHAASSYSPAAVAAASQQLATAASGAGQLVPASATGQQQQMATSASNQHQVAAYARLAAAASAPHHARAMYAHPAASGSHHIINAYAPSPPLYVDDTGGLYGHYGNAYGRYDGGYHMW